MRRVLRVMYTSCAQMQGYSRGATFPLFLTKMFLPKMFLPRMFLSIMFVTRKMFYLENVISAILLCVR
jgi:hypothetical protein